MKFEEQTNIFKLKYIGENDIFKNGETYTLKLSLLKRNKINVITRPGRYTKTKVYNKMWDIFQNFSYVDVPNDLSQDLEDVYNNTITSFKQKKRQFILDKLI